MRSCTPNTRPRSPGWTRPSTRRGISWSPSKELAEQQIKKLKAGAKFEDLAKANSTDNGSKNNGGELGWFNTLAHGQAVRRCR